MVSAPTRAFTAVAAAGLVLATGAALLLGWLSEEVFEGDTSRFDAYIRDVIHARASHSLTAIMRVFTHLGSVTVLACLLAAVVVIFWIRKWRRAAVILVVTMVGSAVLNAALKYGFHRARPSPYFGITAPPSFSYPSGHSLFSFAFFATIAALSTARIRRQWVRGVIWLSAAMIIGLIGFSRIYLGVHYPTDVAAGYLTAFVWVITVSVGDRFYERRHSGT